MKGVLSRNGGTTMKKYKKRIKNNNSNNIGKSMVFELI